MTKNTEILCNDLMNKLNKYSQNFFLNLVTIILIISKNHNFDDK